MLDEQYSPNSGNSPQVVASTLPRPISGRKDTGDFYGIVAAIRRRLLLAIATFVTILILSILYAVTRSYLYQSITIIDLNPNGTSGGGVSDILQQQLGYDEVNSQVATQVEILSGDALALDACRNLGLLQDPAFTALIKGHVSGDCSNLSAHDRTLVLVAMHGILRVDSVAGTNLVRIYATSPNKELSMHIANGMVDAFIESNLNAGVAGTNEVSDWLNGQMKKLSEQVESTQKDLAQFQRDKNIVGSDTNGQSAVEELGLIQSQLAAAAADRIQKEALLRVAQSSSPELLGSMAEGSGIAALRSQKLQLQAEYDQLTTKFGPGYPRVHELSQQIAATQVAIDREIANVRHKLENDYRASAEVENGLNARFREKQLKAFQLNDSAARYSILRQNAESARDLYNAISYRLRQSGIEETLKSAKIRVIEPAVIADKQIYPRRGRMALFGFFIALFSALALAYLVNYLNDSLNVPDTIEELTGLPILVTVPHIDTSQAIASASTSGTNLSPRLVAVTQPMAASTEAYRSLRSSVLLSRADGRKSVQLVTSGSESEGKSLTASNYAVTLAQQGLRVLLVDADLRRGSIHTYFGFPRSPGLSQLLSSNVTTAETAHRLKEVPGLDIITIGKIPPNPSELLNSHRFDLLLQEWRNTYDIVIIDSAPVLPVADSYGLATKADMVILVVRIEQTKSRSLVRSEEILRRLKSPVIGVVVNDITSRSQGYRYHYYGEYSYAEDNQKGQI